METWRRAEEIVKWVTRGKSTPGSGNKNTKGDVLKDNYVFEVKHTMKSFINIQRVWLLKLEMEIKKGKIPCLVLMFDHRGYPYFIKERHSLETEKWSTVKSEEDKLPELLYTNNYVWELGKWEDLMNLGDE